MLSDKYINTFLHMDTIYIFNKKILEIIVS
jgi:hypothetical protein